MSGKKYELTDTTITVDGHILHRIRALRDFGDVKIGDLGGYVETGFNLSHGGRCWIYDSGAVYGDARVLDDASVSDGARVYGRAMVYNYARIHGVARIYGDACVFETAQVYGDSHILSSAKIRGNSLVCGRTKTEDY